MLLVRGKSANSDTSRYFLSWLAGFGADYPAEPDGLLSKQIDASGRNGDLHNACRIRDAKQGIFPADRVMYSFYLLFVYGPPGSSLFPK